MVVRRDPGQTTLYTGGEQIVLNTATSTLTGTRYYTIGGTLIAARTSSGTVDYLIPDRQGTSLLAINVTTQAVTRRQYLPFGNPRGTIPAGWPGDKGSAAATTPPPACKPSAPASTTPPPAGSCPPTPSSKPPAPSNSAATTTPATTPSPIPTRPG